MRRAVSVRWSPRAPIGNQSSTTTAAGEQPHAAQLGEMS